MRLKCPARAVCVRTGVQACDRRSRCAMRRMGCAVWLWQAEPRCGRGCRDEPVLAGVEMRRPGAVAAGGANRLMCRLRDCGAVLRTGLPCGYGWRSRVADGVAVWLWLAEPRCGREELRQSEANRLMCRGVCRLGQPGRTEPCRQRRLCWRGTSPLCANRLMDCGAAR